MEERLKESEAKYRTIFENSGSPMALIKNDLSVLMMNEEFEKLSGYTKKELQGKGDGLKFVHKEDLGRVEEYHRLRAIDPNSVPNKYELRIVDKNGNTKEGYIMVATIPGTDIMVVAFADFTELKKSEQKLKEQKDLLDNINKALEHKVKELEEAMGHIKRLEGLVPICASCKKIKIQEKDQEGRDQWVQLENYISQKTDASLTHGLCPECIKKLYGKTKDK
jgi:PAS domain S-box-containing protein